MITRFTIRFSDGWYHGGKGKVQNILDAFPFSASQAEGVLELHLDYDPDAKLVALCFVDIHAASRQMVRADAQKEQAMFPWDANEMLDRHDKEHGHNTRYDAIVWASAKGYWSYPYRTPDQRDNHVARKLDNVRPLIRAAMAEGK